MKKQVLITSPKGAGMSRHLKPVKRGRQTRAQFTERLLACDPKGQRLYAAQEREIRVFEIRREETDGPRLVQERALKAPGAVSDITCQGHDTIVAIEEKDSAALYQLRGERFAPLARLPAAPREVVATEAGQFQVYKCPHGL